MIFISLTDIHSAVTLLHHIVVKGEAGKGKIRQRLAPLHISNQRKKDMRKQSIVVHATGICALVLALSTVALAADPFVGTWKLNVAKSKFLPGQALKSGTSTFTVQDNGYRIVFDGVESDGKPSHQENAISDLNGKEHPVSGQPNFDTAMAQRVDANTIVGLRKKDGKEVGSMRFVVFKDGKTLTITMKGVNQKGEDIGRTLVYDKQ